MSWRLLLAIAAVTYASRVVGLVVIPELTGWGRDVLERVPAPLFAGLAAMALLSDQALAPWPVLLAFAGALVAIGFRRSLLVALGGGLVGWALATGLS